MTAQTSGSTVQCSVHNCSRPAEGITRCGRSLCDEHSTPKYHPCLYMPDDMRRGRTCKDNHPLFGLIAQIVDAPIITEALKLRPEATSASIELPVLPGYQKEYRGHVKWMGYRNLALTVTFNDGVKWLARVRMNDIYTPRVRRMIMLSEFATIKALQECAPGLVPHVYLPPQDDDFEFTYFFEEFLEGKSLHAFFDAEAIRKLSPAVTQAIGDYADFMIKVSSKSFSGVGCLYPRDLKSPNSEGFAVGPLLSDIRGNVPNIGPFRNSQEMHLERIEHYLSMVQVTPLRPPELAGNPVRILRYLVALELRDLVRQCTEMAATGPTYIKHTDDAAHNMLGVDGRINAIIDWEMAVVVPFAEAFAAPLAFIPIDETTLASNNLTKAEEALAETLTKKGREDLANAVRNARKYHCLLRLVDGPAIPGATSGISLGSVWGTRLAFVGEEAAGPKPASLEEWYADALTTYAHDIGLETTLDGLVHWTSLNADLASGACEEVDDHMKTLKGLLASQARGESSLIAIERAMRATTKACKQARRAANAASKFAADCRAAVGPARLAAQRLHDSKHGFRKLMHSFADMLSPPSKHGGSRRGSAASAGGLAPDAGGSGSRRSSFSFPGSRRGSLADSKLDLPNYLHNHSHNHHSKGHSKGLSLSRQTSRTKTPLSRTSSRSSVGSPTRAGTRKLPKASERDLEDIATMLDVAATRADAAVARAQETAEKGFAAVAAARAATPRAAGDALSEDDGHNSLMSD